MDKLDFLNVRSLSLIHNIKVAVHERIVIIESSSNESSTERAGIQISHRLLNQYVVKGLEVHLRVGRLSHL